MPRPCSDSKRPNDSPQTTADGFPMPLVEHLDQVQSTKAGSRKGTTEIRNPLVELSKEQLLQDVQEYADTHGLANMVHVLRKGALVARSPENFENIEELDEEEKEHLRVETKHRWRQPKTLYLLVFVNSIAAAVQGWDQTGSNGANLSFPVEFGIADVGSECAPAGTCEKNSWIIGAINSAPYIAIFLVACWLSDPINDIIGRRGCIFVAAICSLLAPIGQALSQSWPQLLVCRILLGLGMGLKEVTVPVFSAESAPANIRGALTMSWQMWLAFGLMLGFLANLIFVDAGKIAWRLQIGSAFIPAVPLLIGIYMVPESARWLVKKGRHAQAYNSLVKYRNSPLQAARDLYYIHAQLQEERLLASSMDGGKLSTFRKALGLFQVPRVRRATQASGIIMIAQQMCGINIISFYSSTIFVRQGFSNKVALLVSWGFGLTEVVFAIPALWAIDRFGRRTLLLSTFPHMFWSLLAAGLSFYISESSPAQVGLVSLFIFLFAAFYSLGEGPCAFVYSAEAFDLAHREVGMAWAVATNNFWASVLSISFPRLLESFGIQGSFGFYAGLNLLALAAIFLWLPETKERTLEELDYVFGVSTRRHMNFQLTEVFPWWLRKYVLLKKNEECPQLYHEVLSLRRTRDEVNTET